MAARETKKTRLRGKAGKKPRAVPLPSRAKRPASSAKSGDGSTSRARSPGGAKRRSPSTSTKPLTTRSLTRPATGENRQTTPAPLPKDWKKDPTSRPRTIRKLERVLVGIREHGIIETACNEEKVSKATFYALHGKYADFRLLVDEAVSLASKDIERVGRACAKKAAKDPKYQTTLIFALKAKCGWKDGRLLEVSGPGGGPIKTAVVDLSDEELEAIAYGGDSENDAEH